ncbi:hypothetical protein BKA65DRAFT_432518 [Rhexocercosporidium sp. MPI-PUGE-AT-0058]|nr:hypothetical protein BKA65DRAFT_432518 [Rhexocercosporidium sp. MPI-PUGE-AT-0058]
MQFSTILSTIVPFFVASSLAAPALTERANSYNFQVFTTSDCSGGSTVFFGNSVPAKSNYGGKQLSAKINTLDSNLHITFYSGTNQSGGTSRYTNSATGQCLPIGALSHGVYQN